MLVIDQLEFCYQPVGNNKPQPMLFDLNVEPGEVLSLIGPSGSGKSSLLKLIAGFNNPSAGTIEIDGVEIQSIPPSKRLITMVFQEHNLFPHLDVYTNIALGINPSLKLTSLQNRSIEKALESLGLEGMQKRSPGSLSGGQRQRVALARALVREHAILLLDEPFAALGPAQRDEMIELVKTLVEKQNMCAMLVSHQPADALLASKRTAFINNGRVVKMDETQNLLNHSGLAEIEQYLGS
ncbi:MAG: thiamine transport system ATP-binding protein [Gammaproteobacteria bacterium]|jgi:thiamine transport system ATP-binding protein